jgi:hypothetical protein
MDKFYISITVTLIFFILGVIFWEIRNIRVNHLKHIYERLLNIEKMQCSLQEKIKNVLQEIRGSK